MSNYAVRSVTVTGFVPAPPDDVFALISDTRNDPEWCPNVESAELVNGTGVEIGSKFRFHQHLDRRSGRIEFDADVEIVSLEDRSIVWRVDDRFQSREISIAVDSLDTGSRVTQVTKASFNKKPGFAVQYGYPILAKRTLKDQFKHLAAHFQLAE